MKPDFDALEKCLGHKFTNRERLERAITHASLGEDSNYERLEFLGDRVLNLVVAEMLFHAFPDEKEGDLARRHTAFVRGEALAKAAKSLKFDQYLRLSSSEKQAGGLQNENILADVMEAVLAALYLDAGYDHTKTFIQGLFSERIKDMEEPPVDPKTALQEWSQARGLGLPSYDLKERRGPDHAPEFLVEVQVKGRASVSGAGSSKRAAEKQAAKVMMAMIRTEKKRSS